VGKEMFKNICITSSEETARKNKEEMKRNSSKGSWKNRFLEVKVGENVWVCVQWRDLEVNFDYR
jgi:hypothetical protein